MSHYSDAEERAHALSHGIGLGASLVALPWLVVTAAQHGDVWRLVGGAVFGVSAIVMLGASTLYHRAREPLAKAFLRAVDHSSIYLLIAGTYTPFTISVMRGASGWTLFGVAWAIAAIGILARTTGIIRVRGLSTVIYLVMGWMGALAFRQMWASLSSVQFGWLVAGGLAYTLGVPFYAWKGRPYMHAIWHLFVLAGVGCHFVAILSLMSAPAH